MDKEVAYIVVGAGISLLATLLITISTQLFQIFHVNRQKKWEDAENALNAQDKSFLIE